MGKKYDEETPSSTHSPLADHYSKQNDLNSEASKAEAETHRIKLDPITSNNEEHKGK